MSPLILTIFLGCRNENGQEDYEETETLQLAEQEEEDLNRIKEESRRRTQAILEKYKSKKLQQQSHTEANSDDAEKGTYQLVFKVLFPNFLSILNLCSMLMNG